MTTAALKAIVSPGLAMLARAVTGVRPIWLGAAPRPGPRVYFANHASHGDFILLSACLPAELRARTRAVAAADYWGRTGLRRYLSEELLSCVLIEREAAARTRDPIEIMVEVLDRGEGLIIFPEGTRNMTDEKLLPLRSGLYNLALKCPEVELVPCWIENMSRVLPKGEFLPVPLLCRVVFGAPLRLGAGEDRHAFLARAREAMLALAPSTNGETS
mgnify:CR=1 FL=1